MTVGKHGFESKPMSQYGKPGLSRWSQGEKDGEDTVTGWNVVYDETREVDCQNHEGEGEANCHEKYGCHEGDEAVVHRVPLESRGEDAPGGRGDNKGHDGKQPPGGHGV